MTVQDADRAETLVSSVLTAHLCTCSKGCSRCEDAISDAMLVESTVRAGGPERLSAHVTLLTDIATHLGLALGEVGVDPFAVLNDRRRRGWRTELIRVRWGVGASGVLESVPACPEDHASSCTCSWCEPVEPK